MSGFDDFDFLIGGWTIANEFFLKGDVWWARPIEGDKFPATSRVEKVMPVSDGAFAGGAMAATSTRCSCRRVASRE